MINQNIGMPPSHKNRSTSASKNTSKQRTSSSIPRKRTHSSDSNDEPNSLPSIRTNKHKSRKMATEFDDIKKLIATSMSTISGQIKSSQASLESKFSDLASNLNTEVNALKATVDELRSQVSDDMVNVNGQLSNHEQRILNTEDDIQRLQRSLDLRVVGFPTKENENLLELFESIAHEIGFASHSASTTPSIERMLVRSRTTGQMISSGTIMIHFAMLKHKQMFYSHYLNKMPLNPVKFGLPTMNRIVIGENLTTKNAKIFKHAQIMKKDKKIAQVFTEDGIVKIRLKKGKQEPTHVVRDVTDIELLIMRNEQNSSLSNVAHAHTQPQQPSTADSSNNEHQHEQSHESPPQSQQVQMPQQNANATNLTPMETEHTTSND